MLILQNFEKHEPFCENMNFLTKFCEQLVKPIWQVATLTRSIDTKYTMRASAACKLACES